MLFEVYGPFTLPRQESGLIDVSREKKKSFLEDIEKVRSGLSKSHGCYVFGLASGRGALPWYVGKAEKLSFSDEMLTPTKLLHYNNVLAGRRRGKPVVYLIARVTPSGRLCRPGANATVAFLETMLIGIGMQRNAELRNRKDTRLLRELKVRGVINSKQGHPGRPAVQLKALLDMG